MLLYGPYIPPVVAIGQSVNCAIRGTCVIVGYAEITRWPIVKRITRLGDRSFPLVTKAIVSALEMESCTDLANFLNVSPKVITSLRTKLGIQGKTTEGSRRIYSAAAVKTNANRSGELRTGPPKRKLFTGVGKGSYWSDYENGLYKSMTASEISEKTGRTIGAVRLHARDLKVEIIPEPKKQSVAPPRAPQFLYGRAIKLWGVRYEIKLPPQMRKRGTLVKSKLFLRKTYKVLAGGKISDARLALKADQVLKIANAFNLSANDVLVHPNFTVPVAFEARQAYLKALRNRMNESDNQLSEIFDIEMESTENSAT